MGLKPLFKDIADAIREKDGTAEAITASTFPERIRAIQTGTDTSDATAAAGDILSGRTAYVKGKRVMGTIPAQGAQTIVPGTADKTISSGRYLTGAQTIKGDANLLPGNIKKGVVIFGVTGTLESAEVIEMSPTDLTINIYAESYLDDSWSVDVICPDGTTMTGHADRMDQPITVTVRQYGKYQVIPYSSDDLSGGDTVIFQKGGATVQNLTFSGQGY